MPKKTKSSDVNVTAFEILKAVTGEAGKKKDQPQKNPAAVALGRLGGLKGGKARSAALSKKRKSEIAKNAAKARWKTAL
jgi:hypothetical protein